MFVKILRLFIAALWSPAGKGLASWLLFVMFNCVFVTFPCGILGQVWYVTILILDLCCHCYFKVADTLESFPISEFLSRHEFWGGFFKQSITVKDVPHVNIYSVLSSMYVNIYVTSLGLIIFIIPHVNFPYKTSIDERLIIYNITRCYSDGEYCHSFVIAVGDIIKYQWFV